MIDEQRLRARLAALDAAVRMATGGGRNLVNNDGFVTYAAEVFENWLMRSEPDSPAPAESADPTDAAEPCLSGVGLCDTFWRDGSGQLHRCRYSPGEMHLCACSCGSVPAP